MASGEGGRVERRKESNYCMHPVHMNPFNPNSSYHEEDDIESDEGALVQSVDATRSKIENSIFFRNLKHMHVSLRCA